MGSAWAILVGNRSPVSASVSDVALLALFAPYCGGLTREKDLRSALQTLLAGEFRGIRPREGMDGHAFQLSWEGGHAPLEIATCQLVLPETTVQPYRFELVTHQLVMWLMECSTGEAGNQDLPDAFWTWLLIGTDLESGDT
jgi:hypothetical protein